MPSWSFSTFEQPEAVWGLMVLPLLAVLWWYARRQRHQVLESWGQSSYSMPIRRRWGHWLLLLIVLSLVIGLMGPEWGNTPITPTSSAHDLFLIIDVSQSMLAEDQPPRSRLSRAQQAAEELLEYLRKKQSATRVGLVVFAGQARILCPPTDDLDHVTQLIHDLTTESLGENGRIVDEQGTAIGTSFTSLMQLLNQWAKTNQAESEFTDGIILSDGDDLMPGDLTSLKAPFRLAALAIGDSSRDWPIPLGNGYVMTTEAATQVSQRAMTRRHEERLKQLIEPTGGKLIVEDAGLQPLVRWWQQESSTLPVRSLQSQVRMIPTNRAGWLLGIAGVFLLIELAWGGAKQRSW